VVTVHPGPTGAVDASYAPIVHLLASHGFAVASVDYSGSTGHGRAHRERLLGRFGALDVAECVAAARHLVDEGRANGRALFIRGTSAGGTTALLALCEGVFRGGVAWYPASSFVDDDAGAFEDGYLDRLVGSRDAATTRSPRTRAGQMAGSVLVVQGADDPVVCPRGTRELVDVLRGSLHDVTYVEVPGEGHGFRTQRGRATAFQAELDFYLRCTLPGHEGDARYDAVTAPST
jgi:dipeptidyl aminopeptidase/acylaminoacyl peptidase